MNFSILFIRPQNSREKPTSKTTKVVDSSTENLEKESGGIKQ
ncbi:hypothetical protein [Leptospira interrogans]|nr:hypothetical protein [Leptospira interrogans]